MNLDIAKKILAAAESKAKELAVNVSIAVVDENGVLVAFSRFDNSLKISPDFAQTKAYTSATLGMATADLAGYAVEGKPYFGLVDIAGGKFTVIAGGVPLKIGEKLIGGIGVGGSYDINQDAECAKAGASILTQSL